MSSITIETDDTTVVIHTRAQPLAVLDAVTAAPPAPSHPASTSANHTVTDYGSVIDHAGGLEWQREPFPDEMTWEEADKACRALQLGGHADWRLPTRIELLTLVDDTRYEPAIGTEHFPDTPSIWFWTATPAARNPSGFAWLVSFLSGDSSSVHRDLSLRVRAVRGTSRQ